MTPRVWVSLGSNQERERSLGIAVAALRAHYGELRLSPVYESAAQGFSGEPFLNLVAGFETTEDVEEVRRRLRAIEDAAGRVRGPDKFAPRTLDLDLLLYGDEVIRHERLTVPHYGMKEREFVLLPLAEIAPALVLPCGTPLTELVARCPRNGLEILADATGE